MQVDLKTWLGSLGLKQYADLLAENAIDGEVLPDLTDGELKELGVPLGMGAGARRRSPGRAALGRAWHR